MIRIGMALCALILFCSMADTASAQIEILGIYDAVSVEISAAERPSKRSTRRREVRRSAEKPVARAKREVGTTAETEFKAPSGEDRVKGLKRLSKGDYINGDTDDYRIYLEQSLAWYLGKLHYDTKFDPLKVRESIRNYIISRGTKLTGEALEKDLDRKVRLMRQAVIERGRGPQSQWFNKALEFCDALVAFHGALDHHDMVEKYLLIAADIDPTDTRKAAVREVQRIIAGLTKNREKIELIEQPTQ